MLNEVNFLDKYKKDADALQSILKGLGLWISGVEGHWRIISKNGKDSAVAFSDRDIPFVLMDQDENIVNKSGCKDINNVRTKPNLYFATCYQYFPLRTRGLF